MELLRARLALPLVLSAVPALCAEDKALEGRVLDTGGAPLAGVALASTAEPEVVLAVSGEGGAFRLAGVERSERAQLTVAEGEAFRAVSAPLLGAQLGGRPLLLVAAPLVEVSGRVVDADGAGVEATVSYSITPPLLPDFPLPLEPNYPGSGETRSAADGRFRLAVPRVEGALLYARMQGAGASVPLPLAAPSDVLVTLARDGEWNDRVVVRGSAWTAAGDPAAGARVTYGISSTLAGADGTFELVLRRSLLENGSFLCATLPGLQPALAGGLRERAAADPTPAPFDLRLGGPALSISGRVVDAGGEPLEGWSVDLRDGTLLTPGWMVQTFAEHLAGDPARKEPVVTGPDGSFRLDGLLSRDYVLDAWDPWDPVALRSEPIAAGAAGFVLQLGPSPRIEPLRGRLVDPAGEALPGASVEVRLDLPLVVQGHEHSLFYPDAAVTDREGRFELASVPRLYASLFVTGEGIIPASLPCPPRRGGKSSSSRSGAATCARSWRRALWRQSPRRSERSARRARS